VLSLFKYVLSRVGSWLSLAQLHQLQMVVNYMKLGRFMADHGFRVRHRVQDRDAVFAAVAEQVKNRRTLYLEFGVYKGGSMRYWSEALLNQGSMLHGFDSFEGLPEDFDFNGPYSKGTFSTHGEVPQFSDGRVAFFKGWFAETLPQYTVPAHDALVINLDADLYSSTIYVLRQLRPWIKPGAFIYFDDFSRPEHEPRAFEEFIRETRLGFRLVSADRSLNNAFFECVA